MADLQHEMHLRHVFLTGQRHFAACTSQIRTTQGQIAKSEARLDVMGVE